MSVQYIVAGYLGPRRIEDEIQKLDRLYYLRAHMASLARLRHSLKRITVVVQIDPQDDPQEIHDRVRTVVPWTVEVTTRQNDIGLSYSAMIETALPGYDYTIFNEDDYIFTQHDFDQFLVQQIAPRPDVALVCGLARTDHGGPHAAISTGIMRTSALDFDVSKVAVGMPQRAWSAEIARHGELTDWLHHYPCAYWQDGLGVRMFERPRLNMLGTIYDDMTEVTNIDNKPRPAFLVPIQALGDDVKMWIGGRPAFGRVEPTGAIWVDR